MGSSGTADGYRSSARFNGPTGPCLGYGPSAGGLFVSDSINYTIRQIDPSGMVSTFAGAAGAGGSADGTGAAAKFDLPGGTSADGSGNVFVADRANNRIRRITPLGQVTTIAGTGTAGDLDGTGDAATFYGPQGIVATPDGDRVYVATQHHTVRLVRYDGTGPRDSAASYDVTTVAGNPSAVDLMDGVGTAAHFYYPDGLALWIDGAGDEHLIVADRSHNAIRIIEWPASGSAETSTIAGDGASGDEDGPGSVAHFRLPRGVAVTATDPDVPVIFVSDEHRLRMLRLPQGATTMTTDPTRKGNWECVTLAGANVFGQVDGDGNTARFHTPWHICAVSNTGPSATVYVADYDIDAIRKVVVGSGAFHSGGAPSTVSEAVRVVNWDSEVPNRAAWAKAMVPDETGFEAEVEFYIPNGVAGFSFTAYVESDPTIVNLPAAGAAFLSTVAGNGVPSAADGPGEQAQFNDPYGVGAVPPSLQGSYHTQSGRLVRAFIADSGNHRIRVLLDGQPDPSDVEELDGAGSIETFAGSVPGYVDGFGIGARFSGPRGLALAPDGSLIVSEALHRIRRVWPNGLVTTVAGTGVPGSANGTGDVAQFSQPEGVAVTAGGWIYVADSVNHIIRRIVQTGSDPYQPTSYTVTTVAGLANASGSTDDTGATARFYMPRQLAADNDGRVYVADSGNNRVRVLTVADPDYVTAATLATGLTLCTGIAVDSAHNVYAVERDAHRVTRVSPTGAKVVLVGTGSAGFVDGRTGTLSSPRNIAVESTGSLLVTDGGNHALRAVQRILETSGP